MRGPARQSMRRRRPPTYEFDAALSFAGEDREPAEALAIALRDKGYSIFYDKHREADLWGKRTEEYDHIYGSRTRFVIPFVSADYKRKDWTQYEFGVARREAAHRAGEFILPIRVDDTRLLGLPDETNYLSLQDLTVEEIAATFEQKYRKVFGGIPTGTAPQRKTQKDQRQVTLLSRQTRQALGLVATAILPLTASEFKRLFPDFNWASVFRTLSRRGLIKRSAGRVIVRQAAKRAFTADQSEDLDLNQAWIDVFIPIKDHPDIATFLCVHYVRVGRLNEAVNVLADATDFMHGGWWNQVNLAVLRVLASRQRSRLIKPKERCRLYNSMGISLTSDGQYEEALTWFSKLKNYAQRRGYTNWVGQSWLNAGVAHNNHGDFTAAVRCYRKAINSGKAGRDSLLIARAEGNLTDLLIDDSPDEAEDLLEDSVRRKKALGDKVGLAYAYRQRGRLEANRGAPGRAQQWFERAEGMARKLGHKYLLTCSLEDIATAHYDRGQRSLALRKYRQAYKLAMAEDYEEESIRLAVSQARLCFELGRYTEAETGLRLALSAADRRADHGTRIACIHGIGLVHLVCGRSARGNRMLNRALRLARKNDQADWISRCLTDRCRNFHNGELGGFDRKRLIRAAINEQKRGNWLVAGRLWLTYADEGQQLGSKRQTVKGAFTSALSCFAELKKPPVECIDAHSKFYLWLWGAGSYSDALRVLTELEHVVRLVGSESAVLGARDQRGVCLQELSRHDEALRLHETVVRQARKLKDLDQLSKSLNNLGEALRYLHRSSKAIDTLEEAEAVCLRIGDYEGALSAAYNRALALRDKQDWANAALILRRCRDSARRRRFWGEYVKGWTNIASLAWEQGRLRTAGRAYARALAEARRLSSA